MVAEGHRVFAYEFGGYWQDVGTVESYWRPVSTCSPTTPGIELNDLGWLIYTKSEERPPARIGPEAAVRRTMISHGCVIDGTVEHSVLSPGVRVAAGAIVRDSIVMFDAVIGAGATVDRAIVDKEAWIGAEASVGTGDDLRPNADEPERLYAGITLVGKRARVPPRRPDRPKLPDRPGSHRTRLRLQPGGRIGTDDLRRVGRHVTEQAPPVDASWRSLGRDRGGGRWPRGRLPQPRRRPGRAPSLRPARDDRLGRGNRLLALGLLWPRGHGDPEAGLPACSGPISTIHL